MPESRAVGIARVSRTTVRNWINCFVLFISTVKLVSCLPYGFPDGKSYVKNFDKIARPTFFSNAVKYTEHHKKLSGAQPIGRFASIRGSISIGTTKLDSAGLGFVEGTAALVVIKNQREQVYC